MPAAATIKTRSIQGESLSAVTDRLANTAGLDEGVINFAGNAYKVTQDTGSNMQVKVGSATAYDRAVVKGDIAGQGVFIPEHQNATQTLVIPAAHATLPRIDIVILRVYDTTFDSSGNNYADLEVIQGTPNASPVAPATPNSALKLANVAVAAATTAIVNANITDTRVEATTTALLRANHNITTLADNRTGIIGWNDTLKALQVGIGSTAVPVFMGDWQPWTPTLTNMTLGNGTVIANYARYGRLVHAYFSFVLGSTSTMGTAPTISLPVTLSAIQAGLGLTPLGVAQILDTGAAVYRGQVRPGSSTTATFTVDNSAGTYTSEAGITSTVPMTWTTGDALTCLLAYESA